MDEELKPCPFCGASAKKSGGFVVHLTTDHKDRCYFKSRIDGNWNSRAEPERHVLGVGFVIAETDWARQDSAVMVGISDGA